MNRRIVRLAVFLILAIGSTLLLGQSKEAASVLQPPKGAGVALVIFEDLQCPDCARASAEEHRAIEKYKIPAVRYNFPLPQHNWSRDAAVIAEYFASKSPELGVQYREYTFQNQTQITRDNLHSFAERFAQQHGTGLPFMIDPQGKLAAKVQHDLALGQRLGIDHTPTIYVVGAGQPYREVTDRSQLFQMIEQMRAQVHQESNTTTAVKRSARPK
jgi:protein-disulfide isomerase